MFSPSASSGGGVYLNGRMQVNIVDHVLNKFRKLNILYKL